MQPAFHYFQSQLDSCTRWKRTSAAFLTEVRAKLAHSVATALPVNPQATQGGLLMNKSFMALQQDMALLALLSRGAQGSLTQIVHRYRCSSCKSSIMHCK